MLYGSSIVTFATIIICILIWLRIRRADEYNIRGDDLLGKYCMIPLQVERGEWYRMITSGFIHVQPYHLFMNMLALYNLGSFLEPFLGSIRFAIILFGSVIGGSALILWRGGKLTRTIGISGGLYGLLAAYFVLLFKLGLLADPSISYSIIRTVIINVIISMMPGVSMLGHLGGAITGVILSFLLLAI